MVLTRILRICLREANGNEPETSEKKRQGKEVK